MNDMHNEVITALVILVQLFVLIFEVVNQTTEDSEELDAVVILAFLMVGRLCSEHC